MFSLRYHLTLNNYLAVKPSVLVIIIFIVYLALFAWLITTLQFFKNSGLSKQLLLTLFVLKIAAGFAYAYFYSQPAYFATSDTWNFFKESIKETAILTQHPLSFIKDFFNYGYAESGNLFSGQNSYWNDLKSNTIIKLMAIFNVFSFSNYYVNIIFFNFLFFFGPVAFYRVCCHYYKAHKLLLVAAIFLLPSFLFWCSGAHKDGLIFSALGVLILCFHKQLQQKIKIKYLLLIIACFLLLFALRNFMTILLLPALLIWWLVYKIPARAKLFVAGIYIACIFAFFTAPYLSHSLDFPQYVITKQQEFKQLQGNSSINVPQLQHSIQSFTGFLPFAIDIAWFRPHLNEIKNKSYLPAALEVILLNILLVAALLLSRKKNAGTQQNAFTYFCFCYAISFLLLSGYTITFSGAIVRYRAVVLPLLFAPLMQYLPLQFSKRRHQIKTL